MGILKILRHIANVVVWTVLGLYLLLILVFRMPSVQSFIGNVTAGVVADKLGTHVSVGRVDIGFLNRVTLDDVVVQDQQRKEMLRASRLSVKLDLVPLAQGKVSISSAQVFGAHLRLYQKSAADQPNFQFVLDSLASKDSTQRNPLDVRVNALIMRHSSIVYNRYDAPATPGQLNPMHLDVSDISAHVVLKALKEDSLNVNVKKLSFKEHSGLQVNKLSLKFEGGTRHCELGDFTLALPATDFHIDHASADYDIGHTPLSLSSISYRGQTSGSRITPSDLACLHPVLQHFANPLSLSATFQGKGADVEVPHLLISSTSGDIGVDMSGWMKGVDRAAEASWHADCRHLNLSSSVVRLVAEQLSSQPSDLPEMLSRIGNLRLEGAASGKGLTALEAHSQLHTDLGEVGIRLATTDDKHFTGRIDTRGVDLGRLLDNKALGLLATTVDLKGVMQPDNSPAVEIAGDVQTFEYQSYAYQQIHLEGFYSPKDIHGRLQVDDPHAKADITGCFRQQRQKEFQVRALLSHLSPQELHLSDRWGNAVFGAELEADFKANTLNDAVGTLAVRDFSMTSSKDDYRLGRLYVESGYRGQAHYVQLSSDFGEAELTGYFDYETLPRSVANFVASKLPTLPGLPSGRQPTDNNFSIHARLTKSDWMQSLLNIPLNLKSPVTLDGVVNDALSMITVDCQTPHVSYNETDYRNGTVSVTSPSDSLLFSMSVVKDMQDGDQMDFRVFGNACDNNLSTSIAWSNQHGESMSGEINAMTNLYTAPDGQQTAHVSVAPSHINVHHAVWNVQPCEIVYSPQHLHVKDFTITHQAQFLNINGVASKDAADTLQVKLNGVDVAYVLALVDFHPVDFDGEASGDVCASAVFGDFAASGDVRVDHFLFEHGRMGTLDAHVEWNREEKQIDIDAAAVDGADATTYINGYVSPVHDFIDLNIRAQGTHIDFMHSFTKSFISRVEGHAEGALRLSGPLSTINLTGQLVVDGEADITPTGCTYTLRSDTIRMIPDEIEFHGCPIYDRANHVGRVSGAIHHKHLTQLTFDLFVDADQLLAYDFPDFGDDTFYGTVYGTGTVGIHGRSHETVFDIDITPQKNSTFVYNASNPDAIANQEFIQWVRPAEEPLTAAGHGQAPSVEVPTYIDRSDLRINFLINCTPDATIKLLMDARTNDYITLNGNGVLRATYYNKGGFQMFGTYRVAQGTYGITIQDIIKKQFTFNEGGTIVFAGDPYDAGLNLQAVHTVNGVSLSDLNVGRSFSNTVRVNCLMNIGGQAKLPQVDFDLDIPNVNTDEKQMVRSVINGQEEMNQQVLYLLGIGRFYPQGANNASVNETQQNQTSLAMQSLLSGTLSTQINSLLSSVVNSNDWNFGANISTGDEGWNNAEYEGLVSGRLLNNRLLINGQFGYRDNATTANPSFIGDFDVRYLLYPNGNLAIKVYNQTNDRYFTRSSLNTQGIGLIMKKDFRGWRDLINSSKKKKRK